MNINKEHQKIFKYALKLKMKPIIGFSVAKNKHIQAPSPKVSKVLKYIAKEFLEERLGVEANQENVSRMAAYIHLFEQETVDTGSF